MIEIQDLRYRYGEKEVIKGISTSINDGEIVGIIGKAGSGKTTFLNLLSGAIRDFAGDILINKRPLQSFSRKERLKHIGHSIQSLPENSEEMLFTFILLARLPFKKLFNPFSDYDIQIVEEAIEAFELTPYRDESLGCLSDGILKKAMLAFAFSRRSSILLLDNPTSDLDIHTLSLLHKAIHRYVMGGERTVILALNDLSFIFQTADRVILLQEGHLEMVEEPLKIDIEIIREYFDPDVFLSKNIYNGRPNIHFFPEN